MPNLDSLDAMPNTEEYFRGVLTAAQQQHIDDFGPIYGDEIINRVRQLFLDPAHEGEQFLEVLSQCIETDEQKQAMHDMTNIVWEDTTTA